MNFIRYKLFQKNYILNKLRDITSSAKTENESVKSNEVNSQYNERELEEFNDNRIMLFKKMDNISSSLKSNEYCYNEYFDFCEIQDMTQDILNRDISIITESDLDFILDLFKNFFRLIDYKFSLIKTDTFNTEEFESKYNSYLTYFNNSKTYYYENICNDSIDDELFQQYSNIIMGRFYELFSRHMCVKIGYVFCTDPWNEKSVELFNKIDTFYDSHCVKKEFDKKYNIILK